MHSPMGTRVLAASLAVITTVLPAAAQNATPVALVNPGFEAPYGNVNHPAGITTITGQIANGWVDNSSQFNATIQYAQESNNPHVGSSCQKIVVVTPGTGSLNLMQAAPTAIQLRPGNIYTASVWLRGAPGLVARLYLVQSGAPYKTLIANEVDLTSNWQQVSASGFITTADTVRMAISMQMPGTIWVDDAAVSYTPGTILPSPNLGPISPSFFGMHVQNSIRGQLWNPGFEPPYAVVGVHNPISGQVAANWRAAPVEGATVTFSPDTSNPHSGTASQKIAVQAVTSSPVELKEPIGLVSGATYTVSAWFRGDPATKVQLLMYGYDPPYRPYGARSVQLTANWQKTSLTFQVPSGDTGLGSLAIHISSPGTVWVDDASVTDAVGELASGGIPWPAARFGTLRVWSEGTWAQLEPAKGQWNWGPLDSLVTAAQEHGVNDILLTLGKTPGWASSNPDLVSWYGAGSAAPPVNVQDWRDYVTAVAQRYKGRIRYFEIWNEPNSTDSWSGTVAQLVALTEEAYKILKVVDPANIVVSPCPYIVSGNVPVSSSYLDRLLAAGMGKYVDMLAVHAYTNENPPEVTAVSLANVRLIMAKYHLDKMPLWETEGASGTSTTPPDAAPKTIARKILTDLAFGVIRYDWFTWGNSCAEWCVPTVQPDRRVLTAAGSAYRFLYEWLAGSALTNAQVDADGSWQIWLTRPDGATALVIWNPAGTAQFTPPAGFPATSSHELSGTVRSISGSKIMVTDSPVLLTTTVDEPPLISSVNVVGGGSEIAQNAWVEIRGSRLVPANTPATGIIWSTAPEFASKTMPTQLGSAPLLVTVNGLPAYMYYYCSAASNPACASDQINVLTPLDSTTGLVEVRLYNGMYSASFAANLRAAAPSFPLISGTKYLVATHADYTLVGPVALSVPGYPITPAAPNEAIVLYGFGFGLPKNPLISGSAVQSGPLPALPMCQIGGVGATVSYAGVISPGLYQLNVLVPPDAQSGDAPVTCAYNGANSPDGDLIAIQK